MRVVIAKKLLSTVGGSEAQARALARALAKRHHEVTLVGLRPAWRRPGIPLDVYAAPPGPVELRHEGIRFLFLRLRGGRFGAALDVVLPTSLVNRADLEHALTGADCLHSIARHWSAPLERHAQPPPAAFFATLHAQ